MKAPPSKRSHATPCRMSTGLLAMILAVCLPAAAQLAPSEPDPLARIQDAAKSNAIACSTTGETLCEQMAPKIVANAEGDSSLRDNLLRLVDAIKNRPTITTTSLGWAVAAFRDAKVDVHAERRSASPRPSPASVQERADIVAEIRGREKPDEWVLLGAHLDSSSPDLGQAYNATLLVEAARAIQLTGVHPRRSIRFVLFDSGEQRKSSSLEYIRGHRDELDHLSGAIIFDHAINPLAGYSLNGRRDIEAGVREALEPIYAMGVTHHTYGAPLADCSLDFILEGIPTLLNSGPEGSGPLVDLVTAAKSADNSDVRQIKRNAAIAAVTAFGIAERAEPLGPRQSRAEIGTLLKSTSLEDQMKTVGLWPLWESGRRGRVPDSSK